jgi:large subunit ribosomal protein L20
MRGLWIIRISAAVKQHGVSYSRFIGALKKANIGLDRKVLSEMAIHDPDRFGQLIKMVPQA